MRIDNDEAVNLTVRSGYFINIWFVQQKWKGENLTPWGVKVCVLQK
jgi:hypothetical protein